MDSTPLNIKPGDALPPFRLTAMHPDGHAADVESAQLRGRPFVLFFYPEADTPGWTKESLSFSSALPEFAKLNAVVYGASHNTPEEQHAFACNYALEMPLLSDPEWSYRKLLGNPDAAAELTARITYVVDAAGIVREVIGVPRIEADQHAQAALDSLRALTSG